MTMKLMPHQIAPEEYCYWALTGDRATGKTVAGAAEAVNRAFLGDRVLVAGPHIRHQRQVIIDTLADLDIRFSLRDGGVRIQMEDIGGDIFIGGHSPSRSIDTLWVDEHESDWPVHFVESSLLPVRLIVTGFDVCGGWERLPTEDGKFYSFAPNGPSAA